MFLAIISSLIGLLIIKNHNRTLLLTNQISKLTHKKINQYLLFFFVFSLIFSFFFPVSTWILYLLNIIVISFSPIFLRYWFDIKIYKRILPILDEIILNMKGGIGLRSSLRTVAQQQTVIIANQLTSIADSISNPALPFISQSSHMNRLFNDLREIDRSQVKAIDQTLALRRNLKLEFEMRSKTIRACQPIRAQILLLSFMQISLSAFVIYNYGLKDNLKIFFVSYSLYLLGLLISFLIPRSFRWKI